MSRKRSCEATRTVRNLGVRALRHGRMPQALRDGSAMRSAALSALNANRGRSLLRRIALGIVVRHPSAVIAMTALIGSIKYSGQLSGLNQSRMVMICVRTVRSRNRDLGMLQLSYQGMSLSPASAPPWPALTRPRSSLTHELSAARPITSGGPQSIGGLALHKNPT